MPIAGTIAWTIIGIASLFVPVGIAAWILFICTGMIFALGMVIARFLGEDLIVRVWDATFGDARARQGVPHLVGSFSTLSDAPWAWEAFDLVTTFFADEGYSWSVWAWKRLDDPLDEELFGDAASGWGVYREASTGTLEHLDICHDDLDTLVARVAALRTSELAPSPSFDAAFRAAAAR